MYGNNLSIKSFDDDLWQALEKERIRQEQHIELIASENYASPRILEAQGSVLTISMLRDIPAKGIMVAVSLLILPSNLQSIEPRNFSMRIMQTSNPILEQAPMRPFT